MSGETVYIALGSNLQNPEKNLRSAIHELSELDAFTLTACSNLYQSPPMGPQDQPDYVNAVVRGETPMKALDLLDKLQFLERQFGRKPGGARWGARELDLDILLFGQEVIKVDRLQVPHAGLAERAFVLLPLADINKDLHVPGHGSVKSLLKKLPIEQVKSLKRL